MIFGVDMSSSTMTDNRKKDILILGKGPTQGLEHTLTLVKMYSINFSRREEYSFSEVLLQNFYYDETTLVLFLL